MLSTKHTFLSSPSLASHLARHWESADRCATWSQNDRDFVLPRSPDLIIEAIRHPDIDRTEHLTSVIGPGVVASSGAPWREGRRIFRDILADRHVTEFCDTTRGALERRFKDLDEVAARGGTIDIYSQMTRVAIDVFTKYAFGTSPNDEEWTQLEQVLQLLTLNLSALNMVPGTTAGDILAMQREIPRTMATLDEVVRSLVAKSRERTGEVPHVYQLLVDAEKTGKFQHSTAATQMHNMVLASFLTTGTVISLSVAEAVRSDAHWNLLAEEAQGGQVPSEPESAEDLNLPLSTAAMDETSRLFPPIWFMARKATTACEFDGRPLKPGTFVYIFTLGAGRDERSWENPLHWDPQRFAQGCPAPIDGSYEPFLSGRHVCLGRSFARAEGTIVLSELARRYNLRAVEDEPSELTGAAFLFPTRPIQMSIERR